MLVFPAIVQANDLLRIYNLAVQNDPVIVAAKYARDAAIEVEPKARALLFPQVSGSYNEVLNDTRIDVTYTDPTSGQVVPFNRKDTGADSTLSVTLTQPLFNLQSWFELKQASEQAALAELNFRASEQSLMLRVTEAYFGILGARDRLRSAKAEQDALRQQLDLANQQLEVGLSSITDTQDVEARYDLSVANELVAEQALTAARLALEQIIQAPADPQNDAVQVVSVLDQDATVSPLAGLREDFILPQPQPAGAEPWSRFAQQSNLDLLASELNFDIAAHGVKASWARYFPTVAATGSYSNSRTGGGTFPTTINGPSVALGVTVPIFAGGATESDLRRTIAIREQRRAELDGARRQAERDTQSAYQGVVNGASRVLALKRAVTSSKTALEANQTGLSIGTRSTVDVLNAQQQSYTAQRDYQQSRYDYLLAILRLKAAAGRLTLGDFAEIDGLLAAK
jgi:outer membrane protein